jgi:hypothetical protein
MSAGKARQLGQTFGSEVHPHMTTVAIATDPLYQTTFLQPVN